MCKNKGSDSRRIPTTILHHVNLTFDMRTSNIGVNQDSDMTDNETEDTRATGREPSNRREDGKSRSQDNSHGQNRNDRLGYAGNVDSLPGTPHSNSPGVANVNSVQHMASFDYCVRMEAEGEHLKECGTPFGNRHTTGIPTVKTTLAPTRDNQNKRPRTINGMIHTDANIAH